MVKKPCILSLQKKNLIRELNRIWGQTIQHCLFCFFRHCFVGSLLFHNWARPTQAARGKLDLCDNALFLMPEMARYKFIICPDIVELPIEDFSELKTFCDTAEDPSDFQNLLMSFTIMGVTSIYPLIGCTENPYLIPQEFEWYKEKCQISPV